MIAWLGAPRAHASIYWSNFGNADRTTIGRADDDGGNLNTDFITGADAPCGGGGRRQLPLLVELQLDRRRERNRPVRSRRHQPPQSFVPLTTPAVCGVAVDTAHLYWTATGHGSGGSIGESDLDGSKVHEGFITGTHGPCGVAVNANNIFWANNGDGTIGRSDRNRTGTTKLVLNLPGPGSVTVGGQGVDPLNAQASAAGNFPVRIRATGAAADQLQSTGSRTGLRGGQLRPNRRR